MNLIPVIDLMRGQVVRAHRGARGSYRPIESRLCASSDPITVARVLRDWRKVRSEERDGLEPGPDDLVFVKADGTSMHPDIFSQLFDRTVAKIDVPSISLHDLRHTHATLLLKAGVNVKVVSERLGHANVAFTMNVYQHVLPGMQAAAADTFSLLLHSERNRSKPNVEDGDADRPDVEMFDHDEFGEGDQ